MENKIENVKQLRDDLLDIYSGLKSGAISITESKEQSNVAGKILSSAKIQMEYNKYIGNKKKVVFLDVDE